MKPFAALAISVTVLLAQSDRASLQTVTAIRNWSLSDVTRIAIEVSGDFKFRTDRLHNPERVYFDILNARPRIDARRIWSNQINDKFVQRVRVAETNPGTTRVVVDLMSNPVERERLMSALADWDHPNAARDIANAILKKNLKWSRRALRVSEQPEWSGNETKPQRDVEFSV